MAGVIARLLVLIIALLLMMSLPLAADSPTTHTVAWGETLYSIARAYGVTPHAIANANGINVNSWVYAGTRLTIPTSPRDNDVAPTTPSGYYTVRAGDTLFSIAARFGTTIDAIASANNLPANGVLYVGWSLKIPTRIASDKSITQSPNRQTHIVQPGEFLARIALRYDTTAQAIAYANNLPNDWMIYTGQRLNIPGAPNPSAAPAATTNIRLTNVPLYRQKQTLTCEEASAAMATRGAITEAQLVAAMPRSENPFIDGRGRATIARERLPQSVPARQARQRRRCGVLQSSRLGNDGDYDYGQDDDVNPLTNPNRLGESQENLSISHLAWDRA